MERTINLLSLLYELSLTNTRHQNEEDTARKFVKKFLARKSLQYGAVWKFEKKTEAIRTYKCIYSMPSVSPMAETKERDVSLLFSEGKLAETNASLFDDSLVGKFIYFKLENYGILEFYDDGRNSNFSKYAFHPFVDVVEQFAINLESGAAYQYLYDEIKLRKKLQKSIQSNEEKYRRIIDNIKLGLLEVDTKDIIQHANKPFLELTGYALDEIVGKQAAAIFLDTNDFETQEFISQQNKRREKGVSGSYEMKIRDKNGQDKWVIISGAPNYDGNGEFIGSIGIHLDITEEKKLKQENEFRNAQLQKLFEKSLDALISIDSAGEVIEWSPQAEVIFAYKKEEILGKKLSETIIPYNYRSAHVTGMNHYLSTGEGPVLNNRIEITALKKGGDEFPIELTIFPLQFNEKHYFTAFVRDISEIKKSKENMESALQRQKELNEMKSQFISMTSHELRTPLTTIRTNTELIQYQLQHDSEISKENLIKKIKRIDNNVERLNDLISNILTIGKLDSEKVQFNGEPIFAAKFIKNEILPDYQQQGHHILCKVQGKERKALLDKRLFTQIMTNLIDNAIKYTQNGKEPEIHVIYGEDVAIVIKDYGIGIPNEDIDKLFNKFYRASNVDNIKGSGLGLAIVVELIKLHQGTIKVESTVGQGTSFTINFGLQQ